MSNEIVLLDPLFDCHVKLFISTIREMPLYNNIPGTFNLLNKHCITKCHVLGIIVSVEDWNTKTTITLDDGTGVIQCILWNNHEKKKHFRKFCKLGESVHIFGKLSIYKNTFKQIVISRIVPSENIDSECMFYLQVLKNMKTVYNQQQNTIIQTIKSEEEEEDLSIECSKIYNLFKEKKIQLHFNSILSALVHEKINRNKLQKCINKLIEKSLIYECDEFIYKLL